MENTEIKSTKTFEYVSMQWLNTVEIRSKASTYSKYSELLQKQIIPDLGDMDITLLNTVVLSNFVLNKKTNGRLDGLSGLSAKSIQLW